VEDARTWSRVSVLGEVLEGVRKEEGGRVDVLTVTRCVCSGGPGEAGDVRWMQ